MIVIIVEILIISYLTFKIIKKKYSFKETEKKIKKLYELRIKKIISNKKK